MPNDPCAPTRPSPIPLGQPPVATFGAVHVGPASARGQREGTRHDHYRAGLERCHSPLSAPSATAAGHPAIQRRPGPSTLAEAGGAADPE
jgi:hypothetical protein